MLYCKGSTFCAFYQQLDQSCDYKLIISLHLQLKTSETFLYFFVSEVFNFLHLHRFMNTEEKKIIDASLDMYMRLGVKSVTMDDIAKELGMSKKTIYKYVNNKAELVDKAFHNLFYSIRELVEEIFAHDENAIDELFSIDDHVCEVMKNHHPAMIFQLQKYYPETWNSIEKIKSEFIVRMIKKNLKKGINQGLYRDDLKIDIVALFYLVKTEMLHIDDFKEIEKYTEEQIMFENLKYHIRGIASKKGIEYLEHKLTQK